MDIISQRFIAIGNRIIAELRLLRTTIQQQIEAITKQAQTNNQEQQSTKEVRAELHSPQPIEVNAHSDDKGHPRRDKIRLVVEGFTLAAAVTLGILAYRQWKQMVKATNASVDASHAASWSAQTAAIALEESKKQFRIDERPYIVKEYIKIAKPTKGEKLLGEVLLRNTGRTPALHGRVYAHIDVLQKEPTDYRDWLKKSKDADTGYMEIGSNLDRSLTASGKDALSDIWMSAITDESYHVYVFGVFVYDDVFHESHQTYFCGRHDVGTREERSASNIIVFSLWACHGGNEVK